MLSAAESQELFSRLEQRSNSIHTFRILSRSRMQLGEERSTLRHIFVFAEPDNIRFETLPANGAYTLGILVAGGGRVLALDAAEKVAYRGEFTARQLRRFMGVPLRPYDIAPVLSGTLSGPTLARFRDSAETQVRRDPGGKEYLIIAEDGSRYVIGAADLVLKSVAVNDSLTGKESYQADYVEYLDVDGIMLPRLIRLRVPADNISAELSFSMMKVNGVVPEHLFELQTPSDYALRELK